MGRLENRSTEPNNEPYSLGTLMLEWANYQNLHILMNRTIISSKKGGKGITEKKLWQIHKQQWHEIIKLMQRV